MIQQTTLIFTLCIGLFVYFCTTLGSACVFLLKKNAKPSYVRLTLGFSAGIMLAASIFSLIMPAIEYSPYEGIFKTVPIIVGFSLGVLFLIGIDKSLPHLHLYASTPEGPKSHLNKHTLLFIALTIHNIPEGMALGVSAAASDLQNTSIVASCILALGIGIQNIPEGAAISLPFFTEGETKLKSFVLGSLSGIVEPIAALLVLLLSDLLSSLLPWLLAFAAGAMMYVVIEELIPQSHGSYNDNEEENSDIGTLSVLFGFLLMMFLDVSLGG